MKKSALATTLLLPGLMAAPALADKPGADWISVDEVRARLRARGEIIESSGP